MDEVTSRRAATVFERDPELSMTIHPSDMESIRLLVLRSFSVVSNVSSPPPLARMRFIAVSSSTSTSILTSGFGSTESKILYARFAGPSGR